MGKVADRDIYKTKTGPTTGPGLNGLAENQGALRETLGALPPKDVTILDGAISGFEEAALIVDTEGGGAADDLEVISPVISATENLHNGMLITMRAKDPARVVTVKNSVTANGISTADGSDIVLSPDWELTLRLVGGRWYEVPGRASAQAAEALSTAEAAQTAADAAQSTANAAKAVTDTVTPTPTANAVPQADANGKLDKWVSLEGKLNADMSNADLSKYNIVLQQVRYQTGAHAYGTGTIPWDATIPQNTEGDQYMALAITPKSASSKLVIEVIANFSATNNTVQTTGALFRDSIENALAANVVYCPASTGTSNTKLTHIMNSPGTAQTTFKFRLGAASGGINFNNANNFLGGVLASSIVITEYAA